MPGDSTNALTCCALNARGEICAQPATYACTELHALCPNHAVKTTGRRRTDRRCRVCMKEGRVNDVVNMRDLRIRYAPHSDETEARPGECAAAYDALHPCRRRSSFTCSNGHGACRTHVGLRIASGRLERSCSICGDTLQSGVERPATSLLG